MNHFLSFHVRDLKTDNILITHRGHVKITDFNLSIEVEAVQNANELAKVGAKQWMAPEMIQK